MKKGCLFVALSALVILLSIILYYNYKDYNKERLYRGVKSFYKKECKKERGDCVINFKDIIKQDWDSVYIISDKTPDKIYNLKNIDQATPSEFYTNAIFIKGDSVVYQESFYPDYGYFDFFDRHEKTILFQTDSTLELSPSQAKFKVESDNGTLFMLRPVK